MSTNNDSSSNHSRRSFIQQTLIGGVITATTTPIVLANNADLDDSLCGSRLSIINALKEQFGLLLEIRSDLLGKALEECIKDLEECRNKYNDLEVLIKQLETELRNSGQISQNDNVKKVIELGRNSVQLVNTSLTIPNQQIEPLVGALSIFTQQVKTTAVNCLSEDEILLNRNASEILKKIIEFVNKKAKEIAEERNSIQKANSDKNKQIEKDIVAVKDKIDQAYKALVEGESPYTDPDKSKLKLIEAFKEIGESLKEIKALKDKYSSKLKSNIPVHLLNQIPNFLPPITSDKDWEQIIDKNGEIETIDDLITSLEGIRGLIVQREPQVLQTTNSKNIKFITASLKPKSTLDKTRKEQVRELLWLYCRPGEDKEASDCCANIAPAGGWSSASREARLRVIKNKIKHLSCQSATGDYSPDLEKLAQGLVNLV